MQQRELVEQTIEHFEVSDKVKKGINYHESFSDSILPIFVILIVGVIIHLKLFGIETAGLFGVLMFLSGLLFELYLIKNYNYSSKKAVKYYALEMYRNPSKEKLSELHSWNKNPFDLNSEYHYQIIGQLIEESKDKENQVEFVKQQIPDTLRLIELHEQKSYGVLVEINSLEDENFQMKEEYKSLIQEINYTYKLGAYKSTSILIRKLADNLTRDILLSKGFYENLSEEPTFEEKIKLLDEKILSKSFSEDTQEILLNSLDTWVRKKGNKGAHILEDFETDEVEELMEQSQNAIRILFIIKKESLKDD